jgi:hypothetical protein
MRPRPIRKGRRADRGQVMLLFALMAVLLLAIAGLAVDAGMSYFSSDQVERAAAAAALAGVAYLPGDFPAAENAAWVEASRNGFTNGVNHVVVTPVQPAGTTNELKVTVTTSVPTTFLALVGFGAHPVTRDATAEFLPPIALGQPGALQGSALSASCDGITTKYCASPGTGLGSGGSNFYFERSEGYGNPRSEGDPYTPTPDEQTIKCGTPNVSCDASSNPDYHVISQPLNSENSVSPSYPTVAQYLNYTGGSNYLITVPAGNSVDVQVYNPSFAPDSNDQSNTQYTYHEDDGHFPGTASAVDTDYSAMSYTLFSVPTLSSDLQDTPISQVVFLPFDATCIYDNGTSCGNQPSYTWFPTATGTPTKVNGVPNIYHAWTSVLDTPTGNDSNLVDTTMTYNNGYGVNELSNTGTTTLYFRLEVDTLQWDRAQTCGSATCAKPEAYTNNSQSTAHKGYAVRLVAPTTSLICSQDNPPATSPPAACQTATMAAMGDMTVYTPIESGSTPSSFSIPLFQLDPSYANQYIDVDIFDIGDITFTGGPQYAYVGIQEPGGTTFPANTIITDLGDSYPMQGNAPVGSAWGTGACGGTETACFMTNNGGAGATFNGQWVQLQIRVPPSLPDWNAYWNLVYYVDQDAQAGDTFAVQVGFAGSPDRLLPS